MAATTAASATRKCRNGSGSSSTSTCAACKRRSPRRRSRTKRPSNRRASGRKPDVAGQEEIMQGGLIAVAVAPHAPRLGVEERVPAAQRGLVDGLKQMGQALRDLRPDLFVVNSAHWVSTFNWYATVQDPHHGVCVADEAPDLMPGTAYQR